MSNLLTSAIEKEFEEHVLHYLDSLTLNNKDEWHHILFNQDYYIAGYYECEQWLKTHNISVFEAIGYCQEYEQDNFGEQYKKYDNAETTVNMLVYALGSEWLFTNGEDFIEDLLSEEFLSNLPAPLSLDFPYVVYDMNTYELQNSFAKEEDAISEYERLDTVRENGSFYYIDLNDSSERDTLEEIIEALD